MFNLKASDYQTSEYRGFEITSYLAKGNYGHRRISKVIDSSGTKVDFIELGVNLAYTHKRCVEYVARKIDFHLDGDNSEIGRQLKWQRENPNSLY